MAPDSLSVLHDKLQSTPFLLCLHRFSKVTHGISPLSYAKLVEWTQQHRLAPPPAARIMPAIRLMDFLQRKLRRGMGHTVFNQQALCELYGRLEPGDAPHLASGIAWLMQNGELVASPQSPIAAPQGPIAAPCGGSNGTTVTLLSK